MLSEGAIDWNQILIAVINPFYKICMDFTLHLVSVFQPIKPWFLEDRSGQVSPVVP